MKKALYMFAALAALAAGFSFAASSAPDGLEAAAEKFGFAALAAENHGAFAPDYVFPWISDAGLSSAAAGALGAAAVFALMTAALAVLSRNSRRGKNNVVPE